MAVYTQGGTPVEIVGAGIWDSPLIGRTTDIFVVVTYPEFPFKGRELWSYQELRADGGIEELFDQHIYRWLTPDQCDYIRNG